MKTKQYSTDWIAFKLATQLDLDEIEILAQQAGISVNSAFITQEQVDKFEQACLEHGLKQLSPARFR